MRPTVTGSTRLARLGRGSRRSSSPPTAARATPAPSASRSTVGRRRRLHRAPSALAALAASGVPIRRVAAAKDESDTELAVLEAVARGATRSSILGALGGPRIDHALANVGLLAMPELGGLPDGTARRAGAGPADHGTGSRAEPRSDCRCRATSATSSRCCRSGTASTA